MKEEIPGQKKCYGEWDGTRPECAACKYRRYCKTASDPEPLNKYQMSDFARDKAFDTRPGFPSENPYKNAENKLMYSRADLLEVIAFMAAMDFKTLDLIFQKLNDPGLNISDLARKRGVSRQAMHTMVKRRVMRIPEVATILVFQEKRRKGMIGCPPSLRKSMEERKARQEQNIPEKTVLEEKLKCLEADYQLAQNEYHRRKSALKQKIEEMRHEVHSNTH